MRLIGFLVCVAVYFISIRGLEIESKVHIFPLFVHCIFLNPRFAKVKKKCFECVLTLHYYIKITVLFTYYFFYFSF